jgi:hypothetical protein
MTFGWRPASVRLASGKRPAGVRRQADHHDQHKLTENTLLVMMM